LGGIETVVEVETTGLGLALSETKYRPARFLMSNQVKIKNSSDGEILDQRSLCYASSTKNFVDWSDENGKQLKEEMKTAYIRTAEDIQLLLMGKLDTSRNKEQGLCATLNEKIRQYRHELEPDFR
jgi:hypothetical protein